MKTKKHFCIFFTAFITCATQMMAQSWSITGNAGISSGINYLGTSDPNDLVFRTNAIERGRVLGTGEWRLGTSANNMTVDLSGKLSFNGSGVYQVGGNKYAFQYKNDPDFGLFFNSSDVRYDFRNGTAQPVFYINAASGAVSVGNLSTGVNYILPATRGTNNQILKTDASGNVSWSADNNTTYTAGAGLSLAGTTFSNAAPDQVVTITGDNGITTGGTYPNFTVSGNNLWRLNGNTGTNPANQFIGTRDSVDFVLRTNNANRMRITGNGNVGIGTATPQAKLHLFNGQEVTLNDGGTLIIGGVNSDNMAIDNNEIQARNNSNAATLSLNPHGGTTETGGNLNVDGDIDVTDVIRFGIDGRFESLGSFITSSNTGIVSDYDALDPLGRSGNRWSEVWALDGTINTSDLRDKTNIRDLNYGLKDILKLRSVKFNWKSSPYKDDKLGLVAQELQKVIPEVVRDYEYVRDENGNRKKIPSARLGVAYDDLIPVLIRAIQQQQEEIEILKKAVANNNNTQAISSNKKMEASAVTHIKSGSALLEQNIPNPLTNTTIIRYNIPANAVSSFILITDINGRVIKQISLKAGNGAVTIDAGNLRGGTYNYSLIVDGKNTDTKKMVIAK